MGVLTCSRRRCDNIMCDTYVPSVGYVCRECKEEFKSYLSREGITVYSNHDIKVALECFMNTEKNNFVKKDHEVDIDAFFQGYTQDF